MSVATMLPGAGKSGNGKVLAMAELRNRVLAALNKLCDRDTQQIGVEDLESIAQGVTADGITVFLACLYDTDGQQKAVMRRECVRLLGTLAGLHPELLSPHLPRMVGSIVRRLKDPDSAVRDACADAIASLAAKVPYPAGAGGGGGTPGPGSFQDIAGVAASSAAVGVYMKPLLDALGEQSKSVQAGAAMCLARVFQEKEKHLPTGVLQRLVPRVVKLMGSSVFQAKPGLVGVVASLAPALGAAGVAGVPLLASLLPLLPEGLESGDWALRKASADALLRFGSVLDPALVSPFRAAVVPALQAARFDKVKPVRDSVADALPVWKSLACAGDGDGGSEVSSPAPEKGENGGGGVGDAGARRRSPVLSDRKTNLDFFRKLGSGRSNGQEIQIDVRAPPAAPPGSGSDVSPVVSGIPLFEAARREERREESRVEVSEVQRTVYRAHEEESSRGEERGHQNREATAALLLSTAFSPVGDSRGVEDAGLWSPVCRHLQEIERQQAQLTEQFRLFAASSQDQMSRLEAALCLLERAVQHVRHDVVTGRFGEGPKTRREYGFGGEGQFSSAEGMRVKEDSDEEEREVDMRASLRFDGPGRGLWQSANAQAKATVAAIRVAGMQGESLEREVGKLDLN